jgi:predicted nucleic acid-binding protein
MRVLIDTNIVIHRETSHIINEDIGQLFKWLDKLQYSKVLHPLTVEEINKYENKDVLRSFQIKLQAYIVLQTIAPLHNELKTNIIHLDRTENDTNDTLLLNEVYCERVDILITEDKNIHKKASLLSISDRVFTIDSFLRRVIAEHPALVDYKVLSVKKTLFGKIDIQASFFDSFRQDYPQFDKWFNRKSEETAYAAYYKNKIGAFLYLKVEGENEVYLDIEPRFPKKKRLKIGTLKVAFSGRQI